MDNAVGGADIDIPGSSKAWLVDLERNCLASKPFDESVMKSWKDEAFNEKEMEITNCSYNQHLRCTS